jgi:NAD+ kinase
MKKVAVVGYGTRSLEKQLSKSGFQVVKAGPEFVISYGGDGSALWAEQLYPGIPRLAIKKDGVCKKCKTDAEKDFSGIIGKLKKKKYRIVREHKVEGIVNDDKRKTLIGLNEVNVTHSLPINAIRFDVDIDDDCVARNMIGDGVMVSTPYGSTGYFYSIAKRSFTGNLGVAFNNVDRKMRYKLIDSDSQVKVRVCRGPALMVADNNTTMIQLKEGDVVNIRRAKQKAKIIELKDEKRKPSM